MRKLYFIFVTMMLSFLLACSDSDSPDGAGSGMVDLAIGRSVSGSISIEGDVDWYHYQALEANRVLQVSCTNNTYRPDVDLLVTVYEEDADGNKIRLYADHAREGSEQPTDINMYVHIDNPKDIYIAVRDLKDDEASDTQYNLLIDVSSSGDGNGTFAQAAALNFGLGVCGESQTHTIGYIGDVDTFGFNSSQAGVYEINIDFEPRNGSPVSLCVDLYDDSGALVDSLKQVQGTSSDSGIRPYYLRPYLTAGAYYALVYDSGRNDYDTLSSYTICVKSIDVDEARTNDDAGSATSLPTGTTLTGALEYADDTDYYQISAGSGLNVIDVAFEVADMNFEYKISIEDSNGSGEALFSHNQAGGVQPNSDPLVFTTQVLTNTDTNYLIVEASGGQEIFDTVPYSISISIVAVEDYYDEIPQGNLEDDPVPLDTSCSDYMCPQQSTYKIGYRGDVDWYSIDVTTSNTPQVLEVFVDPEDSSSNVEYYLRAKLSSGSSDLISVSGGSGESIKTSILVPASSPSVTNTYLFRVADYQGDEGDPINNYTISARSLPIESSLPASPPVTAPVYHNEADEDGLSDTVIVENGSMDMNRTYKVNDTALIFPATGVTVTPNIPESGLTTIEFPWTGGYIDYQNDIDFFKIDLGPYVGSDTDWYYDVQMEIYIGSSSVEYIWEWYRDSDGDGTLTSRVVSSSCVFASGGDEDTNANTGQTVSTAGDDFWVGDGWANSQPQFYIGIRDFDYLTNAPDDDWGYDYPYYFKLTLVYHPGESNP